MTGRGFPLPFAAAAALLLVLAAPPLAGAQEPVPPDTVPVVPTVPDDPEPALEPAEAAPRDTVPGDTVPPPPGPAPNFPEFPDLRQTGFAAGVWSWTPDETGRFHGLSLLDLLERVPGVVITRTGSFGRPAGVAPLGAGGGRLRVFVDGWELPALHAGTFDPQRIPLVDLRSVRVVRTLTEVRLEVQTFRMPDDRPFAQIEGIDGDYGTRALRGFFARRLGNRAALQVGLDLVDTDGFRREEPFAANSVFARLGYAFSPEAGLQADFRRSGFITGTPATDAPGTASDAERVEALLRGRARIAGPLWVDAAVGRSRLVPAAADITTPEGEATQAMVRAALELPPGVVSAAVRTFRGEGPFSPEGTELSGRAELSPAPAVAAWGEARATRWGGVLGVEAEGGARLGPWGGVSLLGTAGGGTRGLRFARDTVVELREMAGIGDPARVIEVRTLVPRDAASSLHGLRAGAEWTGGLVRAGAAYVLHDAGTLVPYGHAFDAGVEPYEGARVSGVEAHLSVPLLWPQLRLEGWYTGWFSPPVRPYLPSRQALAALEFHGLFREGNLEPTIRLEAVARDRTIAFSTARFTDPEDPDADPRPRTVMGSYVVFSLYAQVRILDVRAFYRLDNLADWRTADVPGRTLPGTRGMFGVRWFFQD
jgi:hypothetical protein